MIKLFLAAGVLAVALPGQAIAQTDVSPAPLALTLEGALERGLGASHRLAEATARQTAAESVVAQQHATKLPQLAAQAAYTRTNHVEEFGIRLPDNQLRVIYPDVPDNFVTRLDVRWPFYTAGRIAAMERAAQTEAAAMVDDVEALRADVRLEIIRAYWSLATAIESARVIDVALLQTRAHLDDARNQLEAGLIGPSDVLTVEAQESRHRMLSIQAQVSRDVAEAELGRLIGEVPGTRIDPISDLVPPASPERNPEALVEAARRERPERAALVERVAAAEARRVAALAGTKPTVALNGGYDYGRPNPRIFPRQDAWRGAWDAGISAIWPLFDGGRARAAANEASASMRAVQARLAEFDAVLAVELRQRIRELEASRSAIAAADDAVRAATEARRVAGARFVAGVATNTDVLVAQGAVLQAGLDRTQALANARLAEARLARAMGAR